MRYSIIAEDNRKAENNRKAEIKKFVRMPTLAFLTLEDNLRIIKAQRERLLKEQDNYIKRCTID